MATTGVFIRLLTHNVRYATTTPSKGEEPWESRRSRIVNELRYHTRFCPEALICLQEVLHHQLHDILRGLNEDCSPSAGWSFIGVGRDDGLQAGEYSPILYRLAVWRLLRWQTRWLSETPDRPSRGWDAACNRILTVSVFEHIATQTQLLAMNTHLDHRGVISRLESAKLVLRFVREWRADPAGQLPVCLAGDFNSEEGDDGYQLLNGEGSPLRDLRRLIAPDDRYGHQNTFTGFESDQERPQRIDFLFLSVGESQLSDSGHPEPSAQRSSQWRPLGYSVLPNVFEDGVYSSDHRAVVGDALLV